VELFIWLLHWEHANVYIEYTQQCRIQQGSTISADMFSIFSLARGAKENFGHQ